jgi:hypothetical protein
MLKAHTFLFLLVLMAGPSNLLSQEIKIFKTGDFDLMGKVESCLVSTKYGKEEYNFNVASLLTKSVTHYNDSDYDITYYKYENGGLVEKRLENYRDNVFDSGTSIANFYKLDTVSKRTVTEKIVTYNEEFLDQYEYHYDTNDRLEKIIRTNNDGIDEILVSYTDIKGEKTTIHKLNGTIQKSVRISTKTLEDDSIEKTILTKTFLEGISNTALEEIYNENDKLLIQIKYVREGISKKLVPEEIQVITYNELGMLSKIETKKGSVSDIKEFIYQYDDGDQGNWVKEIITPDNTYTTRKIVYYAVEIEEKE